MAAAANDNPSWVKVLRSCRGNVSDSKMRDWYTNLVTSTMPNEATLNETNAWMRTKGDAVRFLAGDVAIRNDTNCWFAVAQEIGRIRGGFLTPEELDALAGINQSSKEVMPDGVVIVSQEGLFTEEQRQRDAMVASVKLRQDKEAKMARMMVRGLKSFVSSELFSSLSNDDRIAIVSRISTLAHLMPDEALLPSSN